METSKKEVTFTAENLDARGDSKEEVHQVYREDSEARKADSKALAARRRILFQRKDTKVGKQTIGYAAGQ